MNRFATYAAGLVVILGLLVPGPVMADEDDGGIAAGKKIFTFGLGDQVPACQKCHGPNGLGSDDVGTPRIASQVYTYLVKQLTDFATDRRTDDYMHQMNAIAKAMTDEQRKNVAAYLHSIVWPYRSSDLGALAKSGVAVGDPDRGMRIVKVGIPGKGLAGCQSCHGFNGQSAGSLFPTLSGQRYIYLVHELTSFHNATRNNDFMGQMRGVAKKLSEQDIRDVATFLTGANPPPPPNNPNDPQATDQGQN